VLGSLHTLTLTFCRLGGGWAAAVGVLAPSLPGLRELSLAGNPDLLLEDTTAGGGNPEGDRGGGGAGGADFPLLSVLDLTNCGVGSWAAVEAVGARCPRLLSLTLDKNAKLATLGRPEDRAFAEAAAAAAAALVAKGGGAAAAVGGAAADPQDAPGEVRDKALEESGAAGPLGQVAELGLEGCGVADWAELLPLAARFPRLKGLAFTGNPCASGLDPKRFARAVLPALPGLLSLSGAALLPGARAEAEDAFLVAALRTSAGEAANLLAGRTDEATAEGAVVIPTLGELGAMPGARSAMDKVLRAKHPHFFAVAARRGLPRAYLSLIE